MVDVLILCYHLVDPKCTDEMSVPPQRLRAQVGALLGRGYRPRTWTEAVGAEHREVGKRVLAVTFDDAFAGTYRYAAPVLAELGVPATVFAPSALVSAGRPLSWPGLERHALTDAQRLPATWDQLRDLASEGWEVGSHSRTHPRLDRLADVDLAEELYGSRAECEDQLQRKCRSLAYPFGEAGARVRRVAGEAGYETAALLGCQPTGPAKGAGLRALGLTRVGVYHGDTPLRLRLKTSPVARTTAFCRTLGHARDALRRTSTQKGSRDSA